MGLRLCLLVLALGVLVSGISRTPSDESLNPMLLETAQISPNCNLTLTTPGACSAPAAPTGGYRCGINCDAATLRNPGWCQVTTTTTNQYRYISINSCTCDNCPTTIVAKTESCKATTRCTCYVNGVAQASCTQSNLCNGAPCPTPTPPLPTCPLGDWTEWGACIDPATGSVAACDYEWGIAGAGIQSRYRDPVRSSSCSGGPSRQTETKSCEANCPPIECVQTPWVTVTPCPECWNRLADPNPPMEIQWSYVSQQPSFGGAPCNCAWPMGNNECQQPVDCNVALCPTDCVVSDWEEWCPCDKSCVDTRSDCRNCVGLQYRERKVLVQPQNGGKSCPELRESRSCNEQPCPIDCQLSTWTPWTQCSSKCGGGQQMRSRYIILSSQYNGTACGDRYEYQSCNNNPCPVSCQVSTWGEWDVSCPRCINEGATPIIRTRHRTIVVNPSNDGADCPPLEDSEQCPIYYCPIDCQYTPWTDWSDCTVSCGGGVQTRKRTVLRPASYGGAACVDNLFESRTCNVGECPRDCVYFWGPYHSTSESGADCSVPCGGGTQMREIQIVVQPNALGHACPPSPQTQPCNTLCCPQDCIVSEYDRTIDQCQSSEFCPSKCGIGFCARGRTVVTPASCGGAACPPLVDWVPCKIKDCDQTCLWSEWSGWSVCPTCGASSPDIKRFREKKLLQGTTDVCGGDQNSNYYEEEPCVIPPCPINCEVSDWSTGPCSVSCGLGVQRKDRTVTVARAYGGVRCPHLIEYEPCERPVCVHDCVLSDWSAWSPCSATCQGAGATVPYQERHRTVLVPGSGDSCNAPMSESTPCNAIPCPIHCILSDWTPWAPSPCGFANGIQRCGLNLQTRHRDIIQQPANGGRICQITEDQQYCDAGPCEHPCEFTPWSEWSFPSATCGTAYRSRHRYLLNANGDTTNCPHLSERTQVQVPPCPVDCEFYYGNWTDCSNEGFRRRHVFIHLQASDGGRPCPTCQVERDDCTPPPSGVEECWLENCDEETR